MLFEPDERKTTVEEQIGRTRFLLSQENQTILIAENNGEIIGFLGAFGGGCRRNYFSAHIVMGILQKFVGQGIGKELFSALEIWAKEKKLRRLELTVMAHNERAVSLYKKAGFEIEGIKKDSLFVNGKFVDEYYMGKILQP